MPGKEGLDPQHAVRMDDAALFFSRSSSGKHDTLWRTDGTKIGTSEVQKIIIENGSASVNWAKAVGNRLYFIVMRDSGTSELWMSNGRPDGAMFLKEIHDKMIYINHWAVLNNSLYFLVYEKNIGAVVWKSDGTPEGTFILKDLNLKCPDVWTASLTRVNNTLYFRACDKDGNHALWRSDGTKKGCAEVKRFYDGDVSPTIENLTAHNGMLYFAGSNEESGVELWKSDGTEEGTVLAADIVPGKDHSFPSLLTSVGRNLFFVGGDLDFDTFYKFSGTSEGAVKIKKIPGETYPGISEMLSHDGLLYFNVGFEHETLWRSNGTESGTFKVLDFWNFNSDRQGEEKKIPYYFGFLDDQLLLNVHDMKNGYELWISNGTQKGSHMLMDINPGENGSYPAMIFPFELN